MAIGRYSRALSGRVARLSLLECRVVGCANSRFLMYDLLGAVISVPLVVSLGYLFGNQIEHILHYIGGIQRALLDNRRFVCSDMADTVVGDVQASPGRQSTPAGSGLKRLIASRRAGAQFPRATV